MKIQLKLIAFILLSGALALTACDKEKNDNSSPLLLLLNGKQSAGDKVTYSADGVSFNMVYVPHVKTFPTGTDDLGTPATVSGAYWIGETEVTYELWYKVYIWATDPARGANQYSITFGANAPQAGHDGTPGSETSSQEPVTYVNWRHAMVWCNALTEWYNAQKGTSYRCVYNTDSGYTTPIRSVDDTGSVSPDPGGQDDPFINPKAKGFRLLTSNEWELAARWRNDATNTVNGYSSPWFTTGNSASHATTYYNDITGAPDYAGKLANDLVAVYGSYWDGGWQPTGVMGTAIVKSKTTGANALGLYDMSGNVWEWCFDLHSSYGGSSSVERGGCWDNIAESLQVGYVAYNVPYGEGMRLGFRFSRTK